MLYLVCSVTQGPILQKKGPGCTICSPGFHHLTSFIWNSKTHGSRGVTRLLLTVCYQAALMSSLTAHRDTGSSLLPDRSAGAHHFLLPPVGWHVRVIFQDSALCFRIITTDYLVHNIEI